MTNMLPDAELIRQLAADQAVFGAGIARVERVRGALVYERFEPHSREWVDALSKMRRGPSAGLMAMWTPSRFEDDPFPELRSVGPEKAR